jgi:hypothetical protein
LLLLFYILGSFSSSLIFDDLLDYLDGLDVVGSDCSSFLTLGDFVDDDLFFLTSSFLLDLDWALLLPAIFNKDIIIFFNKVIILN